MKTFKELLQNEDLKQLARGWLRLLIVFVSMGVVLGLFLISPCIAGSVLGFLLFSLVAYLIGADTPDDGDYYY